VRYLVYLLILTNLAYFAWHWSQPRVAPQETRPAPLPPDVNQLVLLSERAAALAQRSDNDPASEPGPEPESAPGTEAVAAMEPVEAPQAQAQTLPKPAEPVCRTLGPFLKKGDVTSVFDRLARNGYVVNVRDGDVREPSGYWVYLPAMKSSEARRIVADLDARGMTDYYIGKGNYISLGIFKDRDKAVRRQQDVKGFGYGAILDQRFRTRDVYWLDVEERDTPLLGSALWKQVQAQHDDVRAQRLSCE
jgi:hypothetical protein